MLVEENLTTVRTTRLYRLRDNLSHDEMVHALAVLRMKPDEVYWLNGSRPSSLGGYIGNFEGTYLHRGSYSPNGRPYPNTPMEFLTEVY